MRLPARVTTRSVVSLVLLGLVGVAAPAVATAPRAETAPGTSVLQPWLAQHLTEVAGGSTLRVMVRGTSMQAATAAITNAGLRVQQEWPLVSSAVAVGPAQRVTGLLGQPGVVWVEGDKPLKYTLDTAHNATRSNSALRFRSTTTRTAVDGAGISIAIIDSGVESLHPFFMQGGVSKVVVNRKHACGIDLEIDRQVSDACFVEAPVTDTVSAGGHGTHVAGIAAGVPVTTTMPSRKKLRGAATGAKIVSLSMGAGIAMVDAVAAQYWVLAHHQNPCRSAVRQSRAVDKSCPPIRVTNHSYGPTDDGEQRFDERSFASQVQRALVRRGVVAVWAAGNSGGNGNEARVNPDAMDPTLGIISVANYNDGNAGDRDRALSNSSSRGEEGNPSTYPDVSAPGSGILSSCRAYLPICSTGLAFHDGGDYNSISGTSMAAPYVAGVVAQLMQADPRLKPRDIELLLEEYAYRFVTTGDYTRDPSNRRSPHAFDAGHGLVDVFATLRAICAPHRHARCR